MAEDKSTNQKDSQLQQQQQEQEAPKFQFSAPPPKFRYALTDDPTVLWQNAIHWVMDNSNYVSWIAKRYIPFASAGSEDIKQQAYIAAYEAMELCFRKQEPESRFNGYFFIRFKRACLQMAAGPLQIPSGEDIGNLSAGKSQDKTPLQQIMKREDEVQKEISSEDLLEAAFSSMSKKQRAAWETFLDVDQPPGTAKADAAAEILGVSRRETYLLLERGIKKVVKGIELGLIKRDDETGEFSIDLEFKKKSKKK